MAANGSEEALMWGVLWHLGYNMWSDRKTPEREQTHIDARDHLRFDEPLWADLLSAAVGEGVRYESHPDQEPSTRSWGGCARWGSSRCPS